MEIIESENTIEKEIMEARTENIMTNIGTLTERQPLLSEFHVKGAEQVGIDPYNVETAEEFAEWYEAVTQGYDLYMKLQEKSGEVALALHEARLERAKSGQTWDRHQFWRRFVAPLLAEGYDMRSLWNAIPSHSLLTWDDLMAQMFSTKSNLYRLFRDNRGLFYEFQDWLREHDPVAINDVRSWLQAVGVPGRLNGPNLQRNVEKFGVRWTVNKSQSRSKK